MSIIDPTKNTSLIIDDFIQYATQHLTTVGGVISTLSLYPSVPTPVPGPGVINWTGYTIPPATPSTPSVESPSLDNLQMNDAQLAASEEASLSGASINDATSKAFSSDLPEPKTEEEKDFYKARVIQINKLLEEDAKSQPDPILNEEERPKDNIQPIPNYNSKLKVPNELVIAMRKYNICRTPLERAHFIAQTAHESGNFIYKEEIASGQAYEGRKDLGNIQTGDGKRFKGRGYIQLTGRANYRKFGPIAGADFEGNPTVVGTQYFAETACLFWKSNKLGEKCKDSSLTSIKIVTKRINGGYNGLDDRTKKFAKYWEELQKDPTLWS